MTVKLNHDNRPKRAKFMSIVDSMITKASPRDWVKAQNLVNWLNPLPAPHGEPDEERDKDRAVVVKAIALLRQMNQLKPSVEHAYGDTSLAGKALAEAWSELRQILNGLTPLEWEVLPFGWGYALDFDAVSPRERAFLFLSAVTLAGLLDRVRACKKCSKWFVARREKKTFCTAICQSEFWESYRRTPRGKEEQAGRMARWREAHGQSTSNDQRRKK